MNTKTWPSRLFALDVSRGIAALSVVLWHWQHFAFEGKSLPKDFVREDQPLYAPLKIFYENGSMGVEYFFTISGFVFFWLYRESIKDKLVDGKRFFVQRFSRLYPLHFVTLVMVTIMQYFYFQRTGDAFVYPYNDVYHFLLNLGFASKWGFETGKSFNAPIWSVSIEVLLYAIFFLIAIFRKGGPFFCLVVSAAAFTLHFYVLRALFEGMALFFLGGGLFHLTYLISGRYTNLKEPVYLLTAFAWLSVFVNYYFFDLASLALGFGGVGKALLLVFPSFILFSLTVLSLALLEIDERISPRSFAWVGDITYSSYLLHFPLQLAVGIAVAYGLIDRHFYLDPLYLLLFFMVLVWLSYITYKRFEMPMQMVIRDKFSGKSG